MNDTEPLTERTLLGGTRVRRLAFATDYWVSERGRVYTTKSGRFRRLRQQTNPDGYKRVFLYIRGKRRGYYVHRLVLLAFVGPCPAGMEACHGERGQKDNSLPNLRWDTPKMNASDRIRARFGAKYVPGSILGEFGIPD